CGDHVLGRHVSTIVEFDAMAEMERPGFEVGRVVPGLGEFRLYREVGTHARQPGEDEAVVNVLFARRRARGSEAAERGADGYAQDALRDSMLRHAYRREHRHQQEEPERPRTLHDAHERPLVLKSAAAAGTIGIDRTHDEFIDPRQIFLPEGAERRD